MEQILRKQRNPWNGWCPIYWIWGVLAFGKHGKLWLSDRHVLNIIPSPIKHEGVYPVLDQCRTAVYDVDPTLIQHRVSFTCFQGVLFHSSVLIRIPQDPGVFFTSDPWTWISSVMAHPRRFLLLGLLILPLFSGASLSTRRVSSTAKCPPITLLCHCYQITHRETNCLFILFIY